MATRALVMWAVLMVSIVICHAHPGDGVHIEYTLSSNLQCHMEVPSIMMREWMGEEFPQQSLWGLPEDPTPPAVLLSYFSRHNVVLADGEKVAPVIQHFAVAGPNPHEYTPQDYREISLEMYYPLKEGIERLKVTWDLFGDSSGVLAGEGVPILFSAGGEIVEVLCSPQNPSFTWYSEDDSRRGDSIPEWWVFVLLGAGVVLLLLRPMGNVRWALSLLLFLCAATVWWSGGVKDKKHPQSATTILNESE